MAVGGSLTLGDLLALVDLCRLFVQETITLLTHRKDLGALGTPSRHSLQDLLGNLSGGLVLGEGIRIVERVICQ